MTLSKGNHVVKLDPDGQPLMDPQREVYVEFEIIELSPTYQDHDPKTGEFLHEQQFAILKKVR
jgi:hypothetical protein